MTEMIVPLGDLYLKSRESPAQRSGFPRNLFIVLRLSQGVQWNGKISSANESTRQLNLHGSNHAERFIRKGGVNKKENTEKWKLQELSNDLFYSFNNANKSAESNEPCRTINFEYVLWVQEKYQSKREFNQSDEIVSSRKK